ncbi:hypothetical protein HYT84_04255 [Candidatus Micrarchaeota archaeon]|nr:hypothetical protein [Candidatus Micrarchaeota archaeon]
MLYYLLAFFAGILVQATDFIEDERKGKNRTKWLFSILAGILIAVIINQATFATLFLSVLFAQVIMRKIDKPTHQLTFFLGALAILAGIKDFDFIHFLIFLIPASLDEIKLPRNLSLITEHRLFLKLVALFFIFSGRVDYFFGIISFDIGYILTNQLLQTKRILI